MTNKSQRQRVLSFLQRSMKKSAWGALLEFTLLEVFLLAPVQAAIFEVNSPADVGDIKPGDKVCHTGAVVPTCTLRAAIEETNALAGADQIILPPNTYLLTIVTELTITSNLTITGGGASTTIIDGNRSLRSNSGVLVIDFRFAVNLSGVTIRNGGRTGIFDGDGGGGIRNEGTLTLTNTTVRDNSAEFAGGIFAEGGVP